MCAFEAALDLQLNRYMSVTDTTGEGRCAAFVWYRALNAVAYCLAALAICISAAVLIISSIFDPGSKPKLIKTSFLHSISRLAYTGFGFLIWSLVATLGAVAVAPFTQWPDSNNSLPRDVLTIIALTIVAATLGGVFIISLLTLYHVFGEFPNGEHGCDAVRSSISLSC